MTLATYPAGLRLPVLDSYALKRTPNLLRTGPDTGRANQRRRFRRVPTEMTATFRCTASEAQQLEGFVGNTLHDGVAWFYMDVLTPLGLQAHRVRFISDPREDSKPVGTALWEYRCRIEIHNQATLTEEQTATALTAPNSIEDYVTGVEDAVDSYENYW